MTMLDKGVHNTKRFLDVPEFTVQNAKDAMDYVVVKTMEMLPKFTDKFPDCATNNLIYPATENDTWVTGFWTGLLWLCYQYTDDTVFKTVAEQQCESFRERILQQISVDHHDLGFLYSPSCVMGYQLTKNQTMRDTAIKAADTLLKRYCRVGEFIQAWGPLGEQDSYRLIIDCMNNLPLLFWASEETGDETYKTVATKHATTTLKTAVRQDATTYHTFFFDNQTGAPLRGETHQGFSHDSIWARGQAWGVQGFPIAYRYTKDSAFLDASIKITNVFLNRLPKDFVPFWDLIFNDGSTEERDSSSAAIACCGLIETLKTYNGEYKDCYRGAFHAMMHSLAKSYTSKGRYAEGILLHGVYGKPQGHGIDECTPWGDYYWAEALMNIINPNRTPCW